MVLTPVLSVFDTDLKSKAATDRQQCTAACSYQNFFVYQPLVLKTLNLRAPYGCPETADLYSFSLEGVVQGVPGVCLRGVVENDTLC